MLGTRPINTGACVDQPIMGLLYTLRIRVRNVYIHHPGVNSVETKSSISFPVWRSFTRKFFSFLSTSSSSHNRDSRQHHYFNFGFVVIPDVIIKAPPKSRLSLFDDETARHEQQLLKGQTSANNFVTNAFIKAHFFTFIGTFIASMDEPVWRTATIL